MRNGQLSFERQGSKPSDAHWEFGESRGNSISSVPRTPSATTSARGHLGPSRRTATDSGSAFNSGRTGRVCRGMARRTRGARPLTRLGPQGRLGQRGLTLARPQRCRDMPRQTPRRVAERAFASPRVGSGQPPKRTSESPRSLWGHWGLSRPPVGNGLEASGPWKTLQHRAARDGPRTRPLERHPPEIPGQWSCRWYT